MPNNDKNSLASTFSDAGYMHYFFIGQKGDWTKSDIDTSIKIDDGTKLAYMLFSLMFSSPYFIEPIEQALKAVKMYMGELYQGTGEGHIQ